MGQKTSKHKLNDEKPSLTVLKSRSISSTSMISSYLWYAEKKYQLSNLIPQEIEDLIQFYYVGVYHIEYLENTKLSKLNVTIKFTTYQLGPSKCGKTSFLTRFVQNKYSKLNESHYDMGSELQSKIVKFRNEIIKIMSYDVNPIRKRSPELEFHYRGVNGVFFLFDITDYSSFHSIKHQIIDFQKVDNSVRINKKLSKILIGTKCDLENDRMITYDEGIKLAQQYGMNYIEISAKDDNNVEYAYVLMLTQMLCDLNYQRIKFTD